MSRKVPRSLIQLIAVLLILLTINFLLPFGLIPKPPLPNCGPERWLWLEARFHSKSDVIAYFKAHQLELISGSHTPRLGGFPAGTTVQPFDEEIDWQALEQDIQVQQRFGYKLYSLTYEHPLCKGQYYTFKVTSYGLASLFGCCGI